jgi:hypothetical protein
MAEPEHGDRTLMREKSAATTELRLQLAEKAIATHEERLDELEKELATKIAWVMGVIAAVTTIAGLLAWMLSVAE